MRHRTGSHICSICSMAGTASRLASPVPLVNQHRPSATSFHATLTEPYSVQTVARKGRSHRFRWIERMRGFDPLYPLFFHKAFTGEEL